MPPWWTLFPFNFQGVILQDLKIAVLLHEHRKAPSTSSVPACLLVSSHCWRSQSTHGHAILEERHTVSWATAVRCSYHLSTEKVNGLYTPLAKPVTGAIPVFAAPFHLFPQFVQLHQQESDSQPLLLSQTGLVNIPKVWLTNELHCNYYTFLYIFLIILFGMITWYLVLKKNKTNKTQIHNPRLQDK